MGFLMSKLTTYKCGGGVRIRWDLYVVVMLSEWFVVADYYTYADRVTTPTNWVLMGSDVVPCLCSGMVWCFCFEFVFDF